MKSSRFLVLIPLAAGLLSAWPVLRNGFTNDDDILIVNNPYVHSAEHLRENLTRDFFYSASTEAIGYYRPLVKLLFVAEYQLFRTSPTGYHGVSVVFLSTTVLFAFLLFRLLGVPAPAATAAASLLATHPAQAECVAIVASQSDVLSATFLLAALASYVRWRSTARHRWLLLALGAELLALGSKETGVLVPVLAACWELLQLPRLRWSFLRARLHFLWLLLPVAAYVALRLGLGLLPISSPQRVEPWLRLLAAAKLCTSAVLRALVPTLWLPYLHSVAPRATLCEALLWLTSVALLAGVATLLVIKWRRATWAVLLLLVPVLPLLPSSIIHVSDNPELLVVSDRWILLPAAGAGLLWALLWETLRQRLRRTAQALAAGMMMALVVAQLLSARLENASFRDEAQRALWVGQALRERGALSAAEQEYMLAADAVAADRAHDRERAVATYARLAALKPDDYSRRYNWAVSLLEAGKPQEALYQAWLAFHGVSPDGRERLPRNDSFYRQRPNRAYVVALALERLGEPRRARSYYEWCLGRNPSHALARQGLLRVQHEGALPTAPEQQETERKQP